MRLALTTGYNHSKHAIALLHLLERRGFKVDRVAQVSALSLKRFMAYKRQLDPAELAKKLKDRLVGQFIPQVERTPEVEIVRAYLEQNEIQSNTVSSSCRHLGIQLKTVSSLKDPVCIDFLRGVDLVIYAGGGIVGKGLLDSVGLGVLNCHGGPLPAVRGMNALEWAILLDEPTSNTLHYMTQKVDQGPILRQVKHDYSSCRSIDEARGQATVYAIEDLLQMVSDLHAGDHKAEVQHQIDGRQYFTMHPTLKAIVNRRLASSVAV